MWKTVGVFVLASSLAGCAVDGGQVRMPQLALFESSPAQAQERRVVPEAPSDSAEYLCDFARRGLRMPVSLDAALRKEAYDKLGSEKANQLFRPVARANNAFRCICGTPVERARAKC